MSTSNTGSGSSGSKSDSHQGPKGGAANESKSQHSDKGAHSSDKQHDQGSSKQDSSGSGRGGSHEQHVKTGDQSHKK